MSKIIQNNPAICTYLVECYTIEYYKKRFYIYKIILFFYITILTMQHDPQSDCFFRCFSIFVKKYSPALYDDRTNGPLAVYKKPS